MIYEFFFIMTAFTLPELQLGSHVALSIPEHSWIGGWKMEALVDYPCIVVGKEQWDYPESVFEYELVPYEDPADNGTIAITMMVDLEGYATQMEIAYSHPRSDEDGLIIRIRTNTEDVRMSDSCQNLDVSVTVPEELIIPRLRVPQIF